MKKFDSKHSHKTLSDDANSYLRRRSGISSFVFLNIILVAGCASGVKEPNDFGDSWTALNTYTQKIETIPRYKPYVYQATKLDGSLIGLITRWAKDSKLKSILTCSNDYSLPHQIEAINLMSIELALDALNKIYKDQKVNLTIDKDKAIVFECSDAKQPAFQSVVDIKDAFEKVDIVKSAR